MSNEQDRRTIFRLQDELRLANEANAALQAEVERLKSMLSMSQAIAEACGEPQGDGAITVKAATSTGKTVLTDIAAKGVQS